MYEYLQKPWTMDYNCWDHVVEVQEKHFNINTFEKLQGVASLIDSSGALEYAKNNEYWKQVDKPKHGYLILLLSGEVRLHIGTYLDVDGGGVLHCRQDRGVTFTTLSKFSRIGLKDFLVFKHE